MSRNVACRYHLRGSCLKGDACPFYHGPTEQTEVEVCRYFQRGFCAAGESCRFHHPQSESLAEDVYTSRQDLAAALLCTHLHEHHVGARCCLSAHLSALAQPPVLAPCRACPGWTSSNSAATDEQQVFEDHPWTEQQSDEPGLLSSQAGCATRSSQCEQEEEESTASWHTAVDEYDQETWETTAAALSGPDWQNRSVCPVFMAYGHCPRWQSCPFPHGHFCETCNRWSLHPYSEIKRMQHMEACNEMAEREEIRRVSAEQECCICLETVMQKPYAQRMFGLLSCDHVCCLTCVRGWRANICSGADVDTALRCCPVCRQTSHFITPSKVWPRSIEEKERIIGQYKSRLATIDCKYWERGAPGDKRCPFGTSCFYRHRGAEHFCEHGDVISQIKLPISSAGPEHFLRFSRHYRARLVQMFPVSEAL